jgi:hypothetical protein
MLKVDAAKRKSQIIKLEPCHLVINPNFPSLMLKNAYLKKGTKQIKKKTK